MSNDETMQKFLKDLKKDKKYQYYLKSFTKAVNMSDEEFIKLREIQ
jgi:hypothetical protein